MDHTSEDLPIALVERNVMPQGVALVDPDAVVKTCKNDLVALALEIQKADSYVKANACNKLKVIAEQIRFLKSQAENILLEAEYNTKLHHIPCNFVKKPGHTYHLYEKESGQAYLSMLSPEEWGRSAPPQTYKGSFRLEHDRSWTPVERIEAKDSELAAINKLCAGGANAASLV